MKEQINQTGEDELDKSIRATKSIKGLLDNGPLMTILAILFVGVVVCIYLYVQTVNNSRDREARLYEKIIDRAYEAGKEAGTMAAKKEVNDKVVPKLKRVDTTLNNVDSTLTEINNRRR